MVVPRIKKEFLTVILIGLVVIVSGCTLPGGTDEEQPTQKVIQSSSDGVIIESFGPRDPLLMSGETTDFDVIVRNVGGEKAKNVTIYAPYIRGLAGGSKNCTDLAPPIPEKNKEGEICKASWTYTAPSVMSTKTYTPDELKIYVEFNYTTKAHFSIPLYTTNKVNELRREGKLPTATPITSNTYGPIKFRYEGPPYLEVTKTTGTQEFDDLKLMVENVGGGGPPADEYGKKKIPSINMTSGVDFINITGDCTSENITLDYRYCTFKVNVSASKIHSIPTRGIDLIIYINSSYNYIVSKGASLTIEPK